MMPTQKKRSRDRILNSGTDIKEAFCCNVQPFIHPRFHNRSLQLHMPPSRNGLGRTVSLNSERAGPQMMCNQWPITLSFKHVDIESVSQSIPFPVNGGTTMGREWGLGTRRRVLKANASAAYYAGRLI